MAQYDDYQEEPQISPGLLYALVAAIRGRSAPRVPVTQGAMGIAGSAGPGSGFGKLAGRGPRVSMPQNLEAELGGGFRSPGSNLGAPSIRQARGAAGRGDIPSAEYAASTEAPGGRAYMGGAPQGATGGGVYELPSAPATNLGTYSSPYGSLAEQVRQIPAPPVDLNNPAFLKNKEFLKFLLGGS